MKRKLFLLVFLTGLMLSGFGQENKKEKSGGRIEALKVAYITKKLDLSAEEAQRFWPVYNRYIAEVRQVRRDQRENNLPELEVEEKLLRIRKKYNTAYTQALNAEKANAFFRAEKTFVNYVQRELNQRRKAPDTPR